ncbi:hypothetical protein H6801_03695 [Candidatus Nomurabacteria bacterium]|nr:hypothetical protein [Candidatus Nomurabacteria bacterium]
MSIYDSELCYGQICDEIFGGDEEAMYADMAYEAREEELRTRFEVYGSDAPYFMELARRRIAETERRAMIEYQLRGAITQEITPVLDEYLPKPVYECKDLYGEEDDLDARVMMTEARNLVEERVKNAEASGMMPPPQYVRNKWYKEEMTILEDEYKRQLLKGEQ